MCGITGIAGFEDRRAATDVVWMMTKSLELRGPDGEGLESWPACVLGHRRLAIFDLSEAGCQPMLSPDGRIGVTFNGAIYNFRELRGELQAKGKVFHSETDTEVLVEGYQSWGIDGLVQRLRGMFAFGLWDQDAHKLFLVRDRLGVKPLIYTSTPDNGIAFASTVRALKSAGLVGDIDEQAVVDYLEFGYVPDDRAIYRGAVKVPAGAIVEWSPKTGVRTYNYWMPPAVEDTAISFEEAVLETERLFLKAVEKRLFADVPVGSLLSGGVDSSLVCWAIAKLGGDITAFTVGTPGDEWDETEDARLTAAGLGIKHRVLSLSADDAPSVDEQVSAYSEPFACASGLGMLRVSRAVAGEAKVLLTGDGGDDVFLGYPEHRHFHLAQRLARRLPASLSYAWRIAGGYLPRVGGLRRAASFLNYATGGLGAVTWTHDGLPVYQQHHMLGPRLQDATVQQRNITWSQASSRQLLTEFLDYDRRTRFVGEYLTKVDGATMHYALEARSPFLDQDLWEFAARLPYDVRLRGGQLKAILRELARRHLGERVARGRKRGFGVPVQRWLAGRWRVPFEELLCGGMLEAEGLISIEKVLERSEQAAREGSAPNQLWYLFVLEKWLRNETSVPPNAHLRNADDRSLLISG
ncbi:MAG TPA: asparagine synthase (glutamine-hydrolyzing) [Pyrinomonadaceae bacterium]|nr:asparagine synthase (glutamine-hydrolyzing) [Pyrinomonadaceae bacterium]